MAYDRHDYIITNHLRERFTQRTNKRYNHLDDCQLVDCIRCDELKDEIKRIVKDERWRINGEIQIRLDNSEENRACLNNTGFMGWYYEKYGYNKAFEFLIDKDLLFVVVHDEGKKIIVTCVSSKTHLAGKQQVKHKFSHIKKKTENSVDISLK